MMLTRCEARGEEGHMLGAGRCEGYAGGAGGVGMQADAERTVQIVRASCASEESARILGGRDEERRRPLDRFRKIVGRRWPGWVGFNVRSESLTYSISLHTLR